MYYLRRFALGSGSALHGLAALMLVGACCTLLSAQSSSVQESTDLKVELRSLTDSNRFQLGEVIPLEALIRAARVIAILSRANCSQNAASAIPSAGSSLADSSTSLQLQVGPT